MQTSRKPSPIPLCLWIIADTLALADLILRLTKGHIVRDTLYIPIATVILFSAFVGLCLYRFSKRSKEASEPDSDEVSDNHQNT